MVLVVHCARLRQRFGKACGRVGVGVCAPIGHAQLDQCVTCLLAFTARAQRGDYKANVGNRTLRLSGLRAGLAAPLVECEALLRVQRLRVRLGQRDCAIQPVQGITHREQRLRLFSGEDQIVERFCPGVGALVVFR